MSDWKEIEIGLIPEEWEFRKISDCSIKIGDGNYSSKYPKASELIDKGVPFISSANLDGLRIKDSTLRYIAPELHRKLKKGHIQENDILIVVRGNGIGDVALVDKNYHGANINAQLAFLRCEEIDPVFLYYLLSSQIYKKYIVDFSSGSAQPQLTIKQLQDIKVIIPSKHDQEKIGLLFHSLDRKIENLRKQNETLEAIAQTLFKHWFVDFEFPDAEGRPYKSSGGAMEPSELGDIPTSWRIGTLDDVTTTITKGTTPTTFKKEFKDLGINFVKAESITDQHSINSSKLAYIDEETNQLLRRSILQSRDIVYTIAGTIGRYAMVNESLLPANTNQAVAIIRPNIKKIDPEYILCYFSSRSYQHYLSSRIVQAVQANLSLGILSESPIIMPNENIKESFGRLVKPLFQKKEQNQEQIQTLTHTRDALLPKLMSGKLRITT